MLKIVLATSNQGKIKEIKRILKDYDVVAYTDILSPLEIEETGSTYQENAIIKSSTIYNKLDSKKYIVLADDSGISVDKLNGKPNIYSARYAGDNASDKDNLNLLIQNLKNQNITSSPAHYTACISITNQYGSFTTHGWMYGRVITTPRGQNGFGYDPCFIPDGFDKTLGELDDITKQNISHRYKGLKLAQKIIKIF
jgi:XTP/dITP diphosphohydrolase